MPSTSPKYHEPQKLLVPCPQCGVTVLRGRCVDGRVKKLETAITPVFGNVHTCTGQEQEGKRHE
jgi:hypothetical protein